VPEERRVGYVVNLPPVEYGMKSQSENWFMPTTEDLTELIQGYSNCAIARACMVSEQTVRNWLQRLHLARTVESRLLNPMVPSEEVNRLRQHGARPVHHSGRAKGRLTRDRVSHLIAQMGEEAKVVVRQPDKEAGRRVKYVSAHDLRRSCAERLINAGVSAETLMVIMRHKDFATTRKFYGARRAAQAAAAEVQQKLALGERAEELVHDVEQLGKFSVPEMKTLKRLLRSLREPVEESKGPP
jgi:hypothetical protein